MITLLLSLEQYVKLRSSIFIVCHYDGLFSEYLKNIGEVKKVAVRSQKNRVLIHFTDEAQRLKFMLKYL